MLVANNTNERVQIDRLPEAVRLKFLTINQAAVDARLLMKPLNEEIAAQTDLKITAERRKEYLSRETTAREDKSGTLIAFEDEKIKKATSEIVRLRALLAPREAKQQALGALQNALSNYITLRLPLVGGPPIVEYEGRSSPKLRARDTLPELIENSRRRVRELRADLRAIAAAPIHSDVAKARARADIEELAKKGRPDCFGLIEEGSPIKWPEMSLPIDQRTYFTGLQTGLPEQPDGMALLAWLYRDDLIAALDREIDSIAVDANALSDEVRASRRQEIIADILATERDEEALIELAAADGLEILRRADADPRAVLGLANEMPAPKK
jgi:hypothetical protein